MTISQNVLPFSRLRTPADLDSRRATILSSRDANRLCVTVCGGTGCRIYGSEKLIAALREELARTNLDADVRMTGCHGFCEQGPVVVIQPQGIFYRSVKVDDVPDIVHRTLSRGDLIDRLLYVDPISGKAIPYEHDVPFYSRQTRNVLSLNGQVDPTSIDDYIAAGGYSALAKALHQMSPEAVIDEITRAGLRGRGGAGFSTGLKWKLCRASPGDVKYVVCNADEGDPGAYMDRSIMEGNPHRVLEGMILGAYAMGARLGYVYIRAEYPLAIKHLEIALGQMRDCGLLGNNILGSGLSFDLDIRIGAGAFVCGEETALMASIEGRTGEPRSRPPFPAQSGLWGKPTNINNVKSWANVPLIIDKGADWFSGIGTETSKGTGIFSMVGKISNTGLVEVPMGTSLRQLIYEIGGGIPRGKAFKAAQIGGPSGGCIPAEHLNVPIDYQSLASLGAIMGSGGLVITDEDTCMVDLARYFMSFTQEESCGKCVPCRVGTKAMLTTLERICAGQGQPEDLDYLTELASEVKSSSLCGLGQTAPNPVLTTLRYFRGEYEAHIHDHHCTAGVCTALVRAKCTNSCPAEVDVPSYVALVAQGRYAEALEVHRRRNPFALVCGRVCPAFCETKCRRAELDQPIAIRQVKRLMADHELARPWTPTVPKKKKAKVAIIGSGPAGLTAALRLAQNGYKVTVFEALPVAGGMMAVGIPEYRLPHDILQAEVDNIRRAGVVIKLNASLGKDVTIDGLLGPDGFKAVILAVGAHQSRKLGVPGEGLPGVCHGVQFLRDIALGHAPNLQGKRVAVVGGGDVAIDAARSAWRLAASEVHLIYRRTQADMPAHVEEIQGAEQEGIQFHFLTNPTRLLGSDRVTGIELLRQNLGDFDNDGRRRPVPASGSEFVLDVDLVIPAIGQEPDLTWDPAACSVQTARGGVCVVNQALATTRPGVFAAGDFALGPSTVVQAVGQGNLVAQAVAHYLETGRTDPAPVKPGYEAVEQPYDLELYSGARRPDTLQIPLEERAATFREVELPFDEHTAQEECKRCLRCDLEWMDKMELPHQAVPDRQLLLPRDAAADGGPAL